MKKEEKKLLVISFDAIGSTEYDRMTQYPTFAKFAKSASVFREVSNVFLTNTYPIHTSVVTGVLPAQHGIISNTEPFPSTNPIWITDARSIRVKTIWQAAAQKGIKTAAVLWPVTGYAKDIKYNVPEAHANPGKSQIAANFSQGSKVLQTKLLLRHGKLIKGISQPFLDSFATACMVDILNEYHPGLALMHLTAYDAICHQYGKNSEEILTAYEAMDRNLKLLLDAAGDAYEIILFSDHGQLDVHTVVPINDILVGLGLLKREDKVYSNGDSGCFIECCGGSAFFHAGSLAAERTEEIRAVIEKSEGFRRFLTEDEIAESGINQSAFGFCATEGYTYEIFPLQKRGDHGYPKDMSGYKVFYMVRGENFTAGAESDGGSLLDIAPLAAEILGLDWRQK